MEQLQVKELLPLLAKVNGLTSAILAIDFQEVRINKAIGPSNLRFLIETLTILMLRYSFAHKVALDRGFNFR